MGRPLGPVQHQRVWAGVELERQGKRQARQERADLSPGGWQPGVGRGLRLPGPNCTMLVSRAGGRAAASGKQASCAGHGPEPVLWDHQGVEVGVPRIPAAASVAACRVSPLPPLLP